MNFWEMLNDMFKKNEDDQNIIQYNIEELDNYNYVITAHVEDENTLVVNIIETDKWEMILEVAELTEKEIPDVVKGLSEKEIRQLRLDMTEWDIEL
jgi:hypothetical protein